MATTARASVRAGAYTCLQAFATANPTLARATYDVRPTKMTGDMPFAFVEILREDVAHTAGTQQRVLEVSFVFAYRPIENSAQVDVADAIVDGFTEFLKAYAHIATNHVWSRHRTSEEVIETADGHQFPSLRFTLLDVTEMSGRTG